MTGSTPQTVLVAEDNTMIGLALLMDLEAAGYAVLGPFPRTVPALRAARSAGVRPALALVDVELQGGDDGRALAASLWGAGVPSLYVTGQAEMAEAGGQAALGVLAKPFATPDLLEAVRLALAYAAEPVPSAERQAVQGVTWF